MGGTRVWRARLDEEEDAPELNGPDDSCSEDLSVSDTEDAALDPNRYVAALNLTPLPRDPASGLAGVGAALPALRHLTLSGLRSRPHLESWQVSELRIWAKGLWQRVLPSGFYDARAADPQGLPSGQLLRHLSDEARGLVEDCVLDLRALMQEANVSWMGKRGFRAKEAQAVVEVLSLDDLSAAEDRAMRKFGVSLDGLCRAVAARGVLLGPAGGALLQRARRHLRAWLDERRASALEADEGWSLHDHLQEACEEVSTKLPPTPSLTKAVRQRLCIMAVASYAAVQADSARQRSGARGERMLEERLREAGVEREAYHTEEDLRSVQDRLFGKTCFSTPDVVLREPVLLGGETPVCWIDSKGSCPLPGFTFGSVINRLRSQLTRFVELFGPGLVVWRGGLAEAATEGLVGVQAATWSHEDDVAAFAPPAENEDIVWKRWQ